MGLDKKNTWLFQSIRGRLGTLTILLRRGTRNSDGTNDVAFNEEWNTAVNRNRPLQPQDAETIPSGGQGLLEYLGRPLKQRRRACLIDGYVHAAGLGVIHFLEINQVPGNIHNGHRHSPVVLAR